MRQSQFKALMASLGKLTSKQAVELIEGLTGHVERLTSFQTIESVKPKWCPHCASPFFTKNGSANGLQRYRCKSCLGSFGSISNTALSHLKRKDRFEAFGKCLSEGLSVRESAKRLGVSVSTAFRWRHRFLQAVTAHQPVLMSGIVELDETYFRRSQKGAKKGLTRPPRKRGGGKGTGSGRKTADWVAVLVGRTRGHSHTVDAVMTAVTTAEVEKVLRSRIDPSETLVCCDGHSAFSTIETGLGVTTKICTASYKTPGADPLYHLQTTNNYHERLKTWINRDLRGVATKYLSNYLAWMRMLAWEKEGLQPREFILSAMGKQVINI